jgi:hypothetical protein
MSGISGNISTDPMFPESVRPCKEFACLLVVFGCHVENHIFAHISNISGNIGTKLMFFNSVWRL